MNSAPAELLKSYVQSQKFTSTTEVMEAMKDMFRDVIQQVMEGELEDELGYEKSERVSKNDNPAMSKNYRNGYSKKTVKTQLGEVDIKVFFAYPPEVRKIIYTTNIIEGLNRQFRQITKNKPSFTNDDSLKKMLYLASRKIVEHWTARCRNWDMVLNQLEIMFADRIKTDLS